MLLENNPVQAVLKQDLIYTECVTAYLNYLTEESNKLKRQKGYIRQLSM